MIFPAALGLLASRIQNPSLDEKISYRCVASPASAAVTALSNLAGVRLRVSGPLQGEMVILRIQDVPLRTAMDKIAAAATAEWQKTDDGYNLVRSTAMIQSIEHQERLQRIKSLQKTIGDRLKSLAPFSYDAVQSLFEQMRDQRDGRKRDDKQPSVTDLSPGDRLATKLLTTVGATTLADLPNGGRIVFSSSPTRTQRGFPGPIGEAVQLYVSEQNTWSKASKNAQSEQGSEVEGGFTIADGRDWAPDSSRPINGTIGKILMIVSPDWDGASVQIDMKVCDASGNILSEPWSTLNLSSDDEGDESTAAADVGGQPEAHAETPKDTDWTKILSPLAQEVVKLAPRAEWGEGGRVISGTASEALKQFFMHPEEHDPLTLFPSEPILCAADQENVNVALCVDDGSLQESLGAVSGEPHDLDTLSQYFDNSKVENGWFTATPEHPLHSVHESRAALGKFLRTCVAEQRIPLDSLAAYSQKIPDWNGSLGNAVCVLLIQDISRYASPEDWPFIQLYGSLNQTQRSILQERGLGLSELSADQARVVGAIVYAREAGAPIGNSDTPIESPGLGRKSLLTEPTELLPNGLDPEIRITLTQDESPVVFTWLKLGERTSPPLPLTVDQVAMMSLDQQMGGSMWGGTESARLTGFRMGTCKSFDLDIQLPAHLADGGTFQDYLREPGAPLKLEQLPADIQKDVQDQIKQLRKSLFDEKTGLPLNQGDQGSGSVPPP